MIFLQTSQCQWVGKPRRSSFQEKPAGYLPPHALPISVGRGLCQWPGVSGHILCAQLGQCVKSPGGTTLGTSLPGRDQAPLGREPLPCPPGSGAHLHQAPRRGGAASSEAVSATGRAAVPWSQDSQGDTGPLAHHGGQTCSSSTGPQSEKSSTCCSDASHVELALGQHQECDGSPVVTCCAVLTGVPTPSPQRQRASRGLRCKVLKRPEEVTGKSVVPRLLSADQLLSCASELTT